MSHRAVRDPILAGVFRRPERRRPGLADGPPDGWRARQAPVAGDTNAPVGPVSDRDCCATPSSATPVSPEER